MSSLSTDAIERLRDLLILGHARFGEETPTKYCRRCDQWRPLDDFTADKNRSSGKMIYCRYCNRASEWDSSHTRESATPRQQGRKLAWKPTMIDGVEYESRTAAAKALGIAPSTLSRQLRRSADAADASEEE